MLRQASAWAAAAIAGVALGAVSAWAALELGGGWFSAQYGAWRHRGAAGSSAAGPYTRAIVAREGLLALSAREALYFELAEDQDGRLLDESCIYELSGNRLAARWWSVTLYAADGFLAQNTDHAHSFGASQAADAAWRVRIAPVRGDARNWLSARSAGRGFSLTLRVYNPQRGFRADAASLPMLTRLACAGDAQ